MQYGVSYRVAQRRLVGLTWQSAVNLPSEREGKKKMEEKEEEFKAFFHAVSV